MPNAIIDKVVKETNIPKEKVEELWEQAKEIVESQYKKTESDPSYYNLVTGVFKKSLGKEKLKQLNWKTSKPNILESIYVLINENDGTVRRNLKPGMKVDIVLKKDQRTGKLTSGVIKDILSPGPFHRRGIKVRLSDGSVGRIVNLIK